MMIYRGSQPAGSKKCGKLNRSEDRMSFPMEGTKFRDPNSTPLEDELQTKLNLSGFGGGPGNHSRTPYHMPHTLQHITGYNSC